MRRRLIKAEGATANSTRKKRFHAQDKQSIHRTSSTNLIGNRGLLAGHALAQESKRSAPTSDPKRDIIKALGRRARIVRLASNREIGPAKSRATTSAS